MLLGLVLPLAACSNDRATNGYGYGGMALTSPVSTGAGADAEAIEATAEARIAGQRSLASKVLAAIALERVTGRKPDPARFAELHR
jgi:hypothetical protein